ncbi:MAG: MFS transporter [Jaaginema sp. PMC 1079.18]|nr:MFS transporter [Jaaginema sp. PMC 1080.18]MEC4850965.1 MFS transporter [Jaaginema sp. PMC 1079.18]MEC4866234.1 MFS transporter [Jaaginema sp. PMC 1078.18]
MHEIFSTFPDINHFLTLLSQAPVIVEPETAIEEAENAAMIFSGPQFFMALIAGVVMAFAFQLLLTNFGIALGISIAGGGSSSSSENRDSNMGDTIQKIGMALGLGTLLSVTIAMFLACFLAVKLSLLISPGLGAIVGLVIWATFFSIAVWISSSTVGSFVGSVISTATVGIQSILGTATAAFKGKAVSQQAVSTAEAAAAAIRRELTSSIDPQSWREQLEDYLQSLRPAAMDWRKVRSELEQILNDPELQEISDRDRLSQIDRSTLASLIEKRTDFSQQEVERLAGVLETTWNSITRRLPNHRDINAELKDYIRTATPQQLTSGQLSEKLDALIDEMRKRREAQQPGGILSNSLSTALHSGLGIVMGRTDLSDIDVEKIVNQLVFLKDKASDQAQQIVGKVNASQRRYSILHADIENYLANTYSWEMQPEQMQRDFRNVIYDPAADPELVMQELSTWRRSDFAEILRDRGVFTVEKIEKLADIAESIRIEAISVAQTALEREAQLEMLAEVEQYLHNTLPENFTKEKIELNFKPILRDANASYAELTTRLAQIDWLKMEGILDRRLDIGKAQIAPILYDLEQAREEVLTEKRSAQAQVQAKTEEQWYKVQAFLRDTGKTELNPDAIEQELKLMLDDPEAGFSALRDRAGQFDRDTLVRVLTTRNDLSPDEVQRLVDRVENVWTTAIYTPKRLTGMVKDQYEQASLAISEYLRTTGKAELNPAGIKRDINQLFDDPKMGAKAIRRRIAQMDRDTLVQLLAQRDDLSEDQVNQVIDEVQDTLRSIAKMPQRIARRTQQKTQDFQSALAEYLRSTDRAELSPTGIQRDLELLASDPRLGITSLQYRLSAFNRDTLVALLAQRHDISEAEAHQIADRILEVRDRILAPLKIAQERIEAIIERIFNALRQYFDSLERPELNYDGIKRDLQTLFDDPEAGFEALRERFGAMDRDTLVALVGSSPNMSTTDADRLIGQIEYTRDRVLQKAERLQRHTQERLAQAKYEAEKQVEYTRKAAASAAWWLFFTAIISAGAAAGAGALGVIS